MNIFLRRRQGFIYSWQDACDLRERHRIVGSLIGCFPLIPRQNIHAALPLQLLPEEVTLLHELGVVKLLDEISPIAEPIETEVVEFELHSARVYQEQADRYKKNRLQAIERQKDEILEGKRAKRKKREELHSADGSNDEEDVSLDDVTIPTLPLNSSHIQTPTSEYRTSSKQNHKEAYWNFPKSESEKLRYRVFKDLWQKGYFLTGGIKFGCDFLVYAGDPSRYHSFYIAVCVPQHKALTALELASLGRLGSTVKKTVLLCSTDEEEQLTYLSLNWSHIS